MHDNLYSHTLCWILLTWNQIMCRKFERRAACRILRKLVVYSPMRCLGTWEYYCWRLVSIKDFTILLPNVSWPLSRDNEISFPWNSSGMPFAKRPGICRTQLNYAFALIGDDYKISQMNSFDAELYPRFTNLKSSTSGGLYLGRWMGCWWKDIFGHGQQLEQSRNFYYFSSAIHGYLLIWWYDMALIFCTCSLLASLPTALEHWSAVRLQNPKHDLRTGDDPLMKDKS